MLKKTSFFLLFLLLFAKDAQAVGYARGSAKTLAGDVYILTCFVSDSASGWSADEKKRINNKYHEALNWLRAQARGYGVRVNFTGGTFGLEKDIKSNNTEYGNVRIVSQVLKSIGYKDSLSFYNWAVKNTGCEQVVVLIFIKGHGLSRAIQHEKGTSEELYFVESVIVYQNDVNNKENPPSVIAHEMLHAFGAWDLYKTTQQTQERENKAREVFPDSIMLKVTYDINQTSVDEVTAWRVGWKPKTQDWYEWFRPHGK